MRWIARTTHATDLGRALCDPSVVGMWNASKTESLKKEVGAILHAVTSFMLVMIHDRPTHTHYEWSGN